MTDKLIPIYIKNKRGNICLVTPNKTKGYDRRGNEIKPLFYHKRDRVFLLKEGNVFSNPRWTYSYQYVHETFREVEK